MLSRGLSTLLAAMLSSLAMLNSAGTSQHLAGRPVESSRALTLEPDHDNQILKSQTRNDQNAQETWRLYKRLAQTETSKLKHGITHNSLISEDKFDQQAPMAQALFAPATAASEPSVSNLDDASHEQRIRRLASPRPEPLANSMTSALISATTMSSLSNESGATYATINYNGLIGVNATDPFSITSESRSEFTLPTEVQIIMCLFYGTLAFTAIASNMIVCYIVLSNQRMRTATNYFIVNLAMGDIMMALLCIPFTFPANLIFQYWPFGLSLCVIVSYSQANSVFISAYTMVAISIDKYIAIMYPMRLRMPKNQAKIIILAIWSAALLTSLPTALLSSLTPADTAPPQPSSTTPALTLTSAALVANSKAKSDTTVSPSGSLHNEMGASSIASATISSGLNLSNRSHGDNLENEPSRATPMMHNERRLEKLLASPSDSSSGTIPPSKTSSSTSTPTSSTASVLLHSSTPSPSSTSSKEQNDYEENMRYFCQESWNFWPPGKKYYSMALMILQFALPLFVLVITYTRIVIVVWGKRMPGEEDNARDARMARSKRKMIKMVIFCVIAFALTWLPFNALILIGDVHPVIWEHNHIMYIWFITHYLAMCHTITNPLIYIWMNNRFRAGFKQVIGDICRSLQRALAFLLCYCLCLGCCLNCTRQKYARVALDIDRKADRRPQLTSSGSANPHNNTANHQTQHYMTTSAHLTTTNHHSGSSVAVSRASNLKADNTKWTGADESHGSRPTGVELSTSNHCGNSLTKLTRQRDPSSCHNPAPAIETKLEDQMDSNEGARSAPISEQPPSSELDSASAAAAAEAVESSNYHRAASGERPNDLVESENNSQQPRRAKQLRVFKRARNDDDQRAAGAQISTKSQLDRPLSAHSSACQVKSGQQLSVKRKHRRKRTHAISLQMTTCEFYSAGQSKNKQMDSCQLGPATSNQTGKWRLRRPKASAKAKSVGSAECASCRLSASGALPSAPKTARAGDEGHKRKLDLESKFYVVDLRQSSQSTATISAQTNNTSLAISPLNSNRESRNESGDNNTSNSLSAIGNVISDAAEPAAGSAPDQSNRGPLVKHQEHESLLTGADDPKRNDASLVANGDRSNGAAHNDSFDESSASRACVSLKLDDEIAKRANADSGGTLSGATSLEGHQLASSRSTPSHEDDFRMRRTAETLNGLMPSKGRDRLCAKHRQTASMSDHRHLSALSSDEHYYLESADENDDHRDEQPNMELANNSRGAKQTADVTGRRRPQSPDAKSSSTFELVSDQLLVGRRRWREYSNQSAPRTDHCTISIMEAHNQTGAGRQAASRLEKGADDNSSSGNSDLDDANEEENLVAEYGDLVSETMQMRPISGSPERPIVNGLSVERTHLLVASSRLHSSHPEGEWSGPAPGADCQKQIADDTSKTPTLFIHKQPALKMTAGGGAAKSASILVDLRAGPSRQSIANYH